VVPPVQFSPPHCPHSPTITELADVVEVFEEVVLVLDFEEVVVIRVVAVFVVLFELDTTVDDVTDPPNTLTTEV
jgi:hypothetical protein